MRILLLSTYFQPDSASTGVLMTQLAEDLVALGHRVTVVTSFPHYATNRIWPEYRGKLVSRQRKGLMSIYRIYVYVSDTKENLLGRLANYASFNLLSTLVGSLAGRYNLVLAPSPPLTNGIAAYLISRLRRVPFVYNVQDIYPDVAVKLGVLTHPRTIAAFQRLERFIYRKAAAVSVISDGFKRNLLDKGVPQEKIKVIGNFVDTDFVKPLPRDNAFSRTHGLNDKFVVLFAGNIGLSQGLETVLEAARLLSDLKDLQFLFVGDGAGKPPLERVKEELKLENVQFLPFQPHEAIPRVYASSDLCLVPLRRGLGTDASPSKLLTILASGRPVVASVDEGSDTWQTVQSSDSGLCTAPEDPVALAEAIRVLYGDQARGCQLGMNGRSYAEKHFARRQITLQYDQLFASLVPGRQKESLGEVGR